MVELTNEREIETRLPLLNKGYFEASVVHSVCIYGNWSPKCTNCHAQVAKRQFGLDQSLVGELEIFAGSAVLSTLCREYDALQSPGKIWVACW